MKKFTFETQGTHTYLVYSVGEETLDQMSIGMLTENHIDGFLNTVITQLDANKFVKYDISAKLSAKEFLSGYVTKKRLLGVFSGIVRALFSAEEYMLNTASVVLDLDYVYSDVSTGETWLICLPVLHPETNPVQPIDFFKSIIGSIQCDATENCEYFAKILNYLNGSAVFSLQDFGELIKQLAGEKNAPAASAQPRPVAPRPVPQPTPSVLKPTPPVQKPTPPVQKPTSPVQKPMHPVPPPVAPAPSTGRGPAAEKKMSLLYLMLHYSSANLAAYKAQKDVQNPGGTNAATSGSPDMGFAIPGQPAPEQAPRDDAPVVQTSPTPTKLPYTSPVVPPTPVPPPARPDPYPSAASKSNAPMDFGNTVVGGKSPNDGCTVVIGAEEVGQVKSPCLIRVKTREKIPLSKPLIWLGRAPDFVDYCIYDNPAVSQSHAYILNHNGSCVILDKNSTNHTYVNGIMVAAGEEAVLNDGDSVRLANEEFEFKYC